MPDAAREILDEATEGLPGVTTRVTFGHLAYYASGSMFAVAWEDRVVLRLLDPDAEAEALAAEGAEGFDPMRMGKTMRGWVVVSPLWHDEPATLREWARRAHTLASRAPPKPAKAKKAAKRARPKKGASKR